MSEQEWSIDFFYSELLECSRYGEHDDLKAMLEDATSRGVKFNIDHCDDGGTTAMHKAAANAEIQCMQILKSYGAKLTKNKNGNTPVHWAAQNGKLEALKFLIENYDDVDVLDKNDFGVSALSGAFSSSNQDAIQICLEHSSASEEKLIDKKDSNSVNMDVQDDDVDGAVSAGGGIDDEEDHSITHTFDFIGTGNKLVTVRELPITRADNPFGSETKPEDDTTGLGIWPASVLCARMLVEKKELLANKRVIELGSGCGVPGLVAAAYCNPLSVHLTDIHQPAIDNCNFNIQQNFGTERSSVFRADMNTPVCTNVNWCDMTTYPHEKADVLVGADLVYDIEILRFLVPAVVGILKTGGIFLYLAPENARQGMELLVGALNAVKIKCIEQNKCPDDFYSNPLVGEDKDDSYVLHFYDLSAKQPHIMYTFVNEGEMLVGDEK